MTNPQSVMTNAPTTLFEAVQYFSNDAICVEYMCRLRYDEAKPVCPHCGSLNVGSMNTRPKFQCREKQCRKQFSLKRGTLMEDSPVPLNKWLVAIWQVCNCKNGISSYELGRALKVTQATAWFMLHRIRIAMISGTFMKLKGHVEIDETYVIVEITDKFYHCNLKQRIVKHVGETDVAFDKQHLHNLILTGEVTTE